MKNTKRKVFTLVELLVVIAIIGILFVVLISKVDFATEKSKASGVQTDFRSYQLAIETVARENAGLSTLVDDDASGTEKYAALEAALNKNLDPKLRVEIDENGNITTDAKDPWKEQYLGTYLTPDTDGTVKDRGAIVMYSKGSNLKLGSTAEITNGVVNVTIESGKEAEGADDYAISTIYTYVNGYGEIKTTTDGFSNDMGNENTNQDNNTPANPGDPSDPDNGGSDLAQTSKVGRVTSLAPGAYAAGTFENLYNGTMTEATPLKTWDELVSDGTIQINSTDANTEYDTPQYDIVINDFGESVDLVWPSDVPVWIQEATLNALAFAEGTSSIVTMGVWRTTVSSLWLPSSLSLKADTSMNSQDFANYEMAFNCCSFGTVYYNGTIENAKNQYAIKSMTVSEFEGQYSYENYNEYLDWTFIQECGEFCGGPDEETDAAWEEYNNSLEGRCLATMMTWHCTDGNTEMPVSWTN